MNQTVLLIVIYSMKENHLYVFIDLYLLGKLENSEFSIIL